MRRDIIGNKLFATLGAILLTAPVFLLFGAYFSPGRPALWLLPQAFALLLCCPVRALPGKARIPGLIAAVALGAGGMLYLGKTELQPLQMFLRRVLLSSSAEVLQAAGTAAADAAARNTLKIRYVCIVLAAVPIFCITPFVQKYLVTGTMLGAVKG